MKRIFCALLLAALLLMVGQMALAQSPVGESGKLRDYGFSITGAELGTDDFFEQESLTLTFLFDNQSQETFSSIPFDIMAYQSGEELYGSSFILLPETGDVAPGGSAPFAATFLLENEQDVTFTVQIFFNEEDGTFEHTFSLSDLQANAPDPAQPTAAPGQDDLLKGLSGLLGGKETPQPMDLQTYTLGADVLASIPAIVGHRDCVESGAGSGGMQEYTYRSDSIRDDLLAYIDYLGTQGFEVVRGASLEAPGNGELTGPSKDAGQQIHLVLDWTLENYYLRFTKTGDAQPGGAAEADPVVAAHGELFLEEERYEEAVAFYDEAIAKAPNVAAYHGGRGEALRELGRLQEAVEALDIAIELDPIPWRYYNERGVALYFLERRDEAIVDFEDAVAREPDTDDAYYNLAYLQMETDMAYSAAYVCSLGLNDFPDSTDLWLLLGDANFAQDRYYDALVAYDEAIALGLVAAGDIEHYAEAKQKDGEPVPTAEPQPAPDEQADQALLEKGAELLKNEAYDEALALFDDAIARQPNVAAYHYWRGMTLRDGNRREEAIPSLQEAIRLAPQNWEYHNDLGNIFWAMNRLEDAALAYRAAADLHPPTDDAYFGLALVYYDMGRAEDAVMACAEGLALFPESEWLWWQLADSQFALGNYSEVVAAYEKLFAYTDYKPEDFENYTIAKEKAKSPGNTDTPATQPPAPVYSGESRLQNYEDWIRPYVDVMPYQESILDSFLECTDLGDGYVQDAVEYPSRWPSQWLEDIIPEYTGVGWMFDAYVVHPIMSYAAEDMRHVAVTVYGFDQAELDAYINGLASSGFQEVAAPDDVSEWVQSLRSFQKDDCTLYIAIAEGPGADFKILQPGQTGEEYEPFVQFSVDIARNPYVLDTSVSTDTGLLNYEQWNELVGKPADQRAALDQLVESFPDEYGRLYETTYFPSRWPKDIFGDLIPECKINGVMYYMLVTTPAATPTRDKTLIASMFIAGHYPEYVEQYAQEVADFGYREIPREEYTQDEIAASEGRDSYHVFALPNMRCTVAAYQEDGMDLMQVALRWDGRYKNFFNQ